MIDQPCTLGGDATTIVLNVGTALPAALAVDGAALAFDPTAQGAGCATTATGASCFGIERGQLGRSNGSDLTPSASPLVLH